VPETEMAIEKLERHKSPGVDPQQSGLKQEVGQFVLRSLNINSVWNKEEIALRSGRSLSLYVFLRRVIKEIVVIIEAYHFCQVHTKF
jgi:hypothetical protein